MRGMMHRRRRYAAALYSLSLGLTTFAACGEQPASSTHLQSEQTCPASDLDEICAAPATAITADTFESRTAPPVVAGTTYAVTGAGKHSYLVFKPTATGSYTVYTSATYYQFCDLSPTCIRDIDDCPSFELVAQYDLKASDADVIDLGPLQAGETAYLRIEAATTTPPPPTTTPIVFAAILDGQSVPDLYSVAPDGTGLTRLTTTATASELFPSLSPDGTNVAFDRDGTLVVHELATGNEVLASPTLGRNRGTSNPAWSPDGTRLVYPFPRDPFIVGDPDDSTDESYATSLHFVNADGTGDIALDEPAGPGSPPGLGTLSEPAWSSTNLIAFTVADDCPDCAGGSRYALIAPDGSGYQDVQPTDATNINDPRHGLDWSPDATRWVYTVRPMGNSSDLEVPGTIATRSSTSTTGAITLTTAGAWWPRWSPDGTGIAFLRADGVYVMNADGTNQHRVVAATGVRGLDW